MSEIIAVTSGKGGTGKSSICACLGFALARQGHRTLILELDIGLRCLDIMLGMQGSVPYDLGDVVNGTSDVYKATTVVKMATNLNFIAAPRDPFVTINADNIKKITEQIRQYYDYIIVDTSAGINENVFDIVSRSDTIMIVTTPDPVCIRDAQMMSDEFYMRGNKSQRLIINKFNKKVYNSDLVHSIDSIIDTVGVQLIGVIPEDTDLTISTGKGKALSSSSKAFIAFDAISKRIKGEDIPLTII